VVQLEERCALTGKGPDRVLVEAALRLERAQRDGSECGRVAAVLEVVVLAEVPPHSIGAEA
jgi:hypothetical protein